MVVPPKHPKMVIFSRKTNGCWVPPSYETPKWSPKWCNHRSRDWSCLQTGSMKSLCLPFGTSVFSFEYVIIHGDVSPTGTTRSQIFRIADVNLHLYLAFWVGGLTPWRMAWGLISHPCQGERNASSRESLPKGIFQKRPGMLDPDLSF